MPEPTRSNRPRSAPSHAAELNRRGISVSLRMRELVKLFGRQLSIDLNAHGVTIGQWRFLRVLWAGDGRSQKDIADALGLTPSAMVSALGALERDGLVVRRRADADARVSRIHLTPKSRALERTLMPYARDSQIKALATFDVAEIDMLLTFLDRIRDNLLDDLERRDEGAPRSKAAGRRDGTRPAATAPRPGRRPRAQPDPA